MMGPRIWHGIPDRTSIQRHLRWPGIGVFRKCGGVVGAVVPTRDARYSATRRKPGDLSGLSLSLAAIVTWECAASGMVDQFIRLLGIRSFAL